MKRKEIGKGGYGTVYSDGKHAIKKFKNERSFLFEAVNCSAFKGTENIIQMLKYDIKNLEIYFPLCDEDLHKWIQRKHPESLKINIIKQIIKGLYHIHRQRKVHCDLKMDNILLKHNGNDVDVFIGDLGLLSSEGNFCKSQYCTRYYREENVTKSKSHDIFSLGVIFLCLLSTYPVKKKDLDSYDTAIKKSNDIRNKKYANLASKMLNANKSERPSIKEIYYITIDEKPQYSKFNRSINFLLPEKVHNTIVFYVNKAFKKLNIERRDNGEKRKKKKFEGAICHYISANSPYASDLHIKNVVNDGILLLRALYVRENIVLRSQTGILHHLISDQIFCSTISMR